MTVLPENQGGTGQNTYLDGQLLIGNSATNGLVKATLTASTGVSIVTGNGSITISASGSGGTLTSLTAGTGITFTPSVITQTGQISLTVPVTVANGGTGVSAGFTPANALMLSGVTPTGALQASQNWYQSSLVTGVLEGNLNVAVIPAAVTAITGLSLVVQAIDAAPNAFAQVSYGAADQNINFRAEGSGVSPTATSPGVNIINFVARGFDGANWVTTNMGTFSLRTQNLTATTDHSTFAVLSLTPTTSTTIQVVAQWFPGVNGGVSFQGDATGGTATAGWVGEEGSNITLIAAGTQLVSTSVVYTISSQSLAAGDWEVSGEAWFNAGATTTILGVSAGLNSVSNVFPAVPSDGTSRSGAPWTGTFPANMTLPLAPIRINSPTATTIFLVAQANFTAGTLTGFGKIHWRRAR